MHYNASRVKRAKRGDVPVNTDFESALAALVDGGVEFLIVGGLAATVHSSARLTQDIDILYRRSPENLSLNFGAPGQAWRKRM